MNKIYKIVLVTVTLAILGILYFTRYTTIKAGSDEILFYNPFTIDEIGFRDNYDRAIVYIGKGDSTSSKKCFEKAIKYRGIHNKKVRENIYSCGNGLWEYKQDIFI